MKIFKTLKDKVASYKRRKYIEKLAREAVKEWIRKNELEIAYMLKYNESPQEKKNIQDK